MTLAAAALDQGENVVARPGADFEHARGCTGDFPRKRLKHPRIDPAVLRKASGEPVVVALHRDIRRHGVDIFSGSAVFRDFNGFLRHFSDYRKIGVSHTRWQKPPCPGTYSENPEPDR